MLPTQPLRFSPVFRSYLWGGSKLADRLGKKVPGPGEWAESWKLSIMAKINPWSSMAIGRGGAFGS